ncbi:MAG: putative response regulator receiver protein, partial [Phycisphaerales bacterium]|nr:putative response regulator receiver protein [Phycisphaerales bacterium]
MVPLNDTRCKVLVLSGQGRYGQAIDSLRTSCDVVQIGSIDQAIDALRTDQFSAIFSDSGDFLPLERALVSQQANLILNTIGEGVCIVDAEGRANWTNKKMQAWPPRVHEKIRRACQGSFEIFSKQVGPGGPDAPPPFARSKRYALNIEDQQFMEMICSPVINPAGQVVQVVAVVWDATGTRRLQQKIDAIDKAGRELVRLESDLMSKLTVVQRLKLLEDKIISYTKELMHFDHFVVRLLDRRSNRLEPVISVGIPSDALNVELYAGSEGNGISGYVAATGRSYICPDVERDPRYIHGLDQAKSSLTVPLTLHDKVIGVFNIESQQRAAFNEDDRQFSEIFARYVAIALNILDLMIVERVSTSHKVADVVCSEVAGPLNDIASDAAALVDQFIGNDELRSKLKAILANALTIRKSLDQAAQGPNTAVLGAQDVVGEADPILNGARILVADDEPNIRTTIHDVLHKYRADVTVATNGGEACDLIEANDYDLILSDIRMPDKNGYEVFAAARVKSETLPVILMTGFGYDPAH